MNRFAELLDRLSYEPGRNNKLRLITAYFREVGDPDRGYALAALTGALSFKHAKPGLVRDLIADRTDPTLFALSYDYVGDLSETVALMWPKSCFFPPPPAQRWGGVGAGWAAPRARIPKLAPNLPKHPPRPTPRRELRSSRPHHALRVWREGRSRSRATTTLPHLPSPKWSPRYAPSARPSCRSSFRAGSTS